MNETTAQSISPLAHANHALPRHAFKPVLGHEVHVTEWGDPAKPALVMWHGLARTGRDFDELARHFAAHWFVICPDTIGRGLSSWSASPDTDYTVAHYADLAAALLDAYGITRAGWIGTSMGGLIGMRMASGRHAPRLSWLLINDIGPEIPQEAIDRILSYSRVPPVFRTVSEAETMLRTAYAPFGPASDGFWRRMAMTSVRRLPDGTLTTHFDPRIVAMLIDNSAELTVWDRWDRITIPVHVTAGVTSDILPKDIADRMAATGPRPGITWWPDCGHAPSLSRDKDLGIVSALVAQLQSRSADAGP